MVANSEKLFRKIEKGWREIGQAVGRYVKKCNDSYHLDLTKWPNLSRLDDEEESAHDSVHIGLKDVLLFPRWPAKSNSRKQICIGISGDFRCRFRPGSTEIVELLSYCTEVGYFKHTNFKYPREVECLDGYHFDFEPTLQRAHPVFHAQRNESALISKITNRGYNVDDQTRPPATLHHVHLPTPQVDLISALIMIVADHAVDSNDECEQAFLLLRGKIREKLRLVASPNDNADLGECVKHEEILLDHWYAKT